MIGKVTIKRRSARISTKNRRESTENIEIKMGNVQSNDDKEGTINISSHESFHRSNADAREQLQFAKGSDDLAVLDLLASISGLSSQEVPENEQVAMEEDTGRETSATLTDAQSPQPMSEETSTNSLSTQDFLDVPPSQQSSSEDFEEIVEGEQEGKECYRVEKRI